MKMLNDDKTDFSTEVLVQMAIMLEAVYAAELIAYRISGTLDNMGLRKTLIQEKKQAYNKARREIQQIISHLEIAFDATFDQIITKTGEDFEIYSDYLQAMANDIVQLLLIYYSRGDGDQAKKDAMKKALKNFKPIDGIDLESMMKYYNFKF